MKGARTKQDSAERGHAEDCARNFRCSLTHTRRLGV